MRTSDAIFVAGEQTLLGSAIARQLRHHGYTRLGDGSARDVDCADSAAVEEYFRANKPAIVFVAAGKSAGIVGNLNRPAELMLDNLAVSLNVLQAAAKHGVRKLLYLGSSCIYPRACPQPMSPASLLTGPFEPTNDAYAMAKIAGVKLCQALRRERLCDFIAGIPANSFGIDDDFSDENSHVIGALMGRMHAAKLANEKNVGVWGSGNTRREFLFADDLADAAIFAIQHYSDEEPINLGGGETVSIRELATLIQQTVGFTGDLVFDTSKPDGMPFKSLDSSVLMNLGYKPRTALAEALQLTYQHYLTIFHP